MSQAVCYKSNWLADEAHNGSNITQKSQCGHNLRKRRRRSKEKKSTKTILEPRKRWRISWLLKSLPERGRILNGLSNSSHRLPVTFESFEERKTPVCNTKKKFHILVKHIRILPVSMAAIHRLANDLVWQLNWNSVETVGTRCSSARNTTPSSIQSTRLRVLTFNSWHLEVWAELSHRSGFPGVLHQWCSLSNSLPNSPVIRWQKQTLNSSSSHLLTCLESTNFGCGRWWTV